MGAFASKEADKTDVTAEKWNPAWIFLTLKHDIDTLTFHLMCVEVYKVLLLREIQAQIIILSSLSSKYFQILLTRKISLWGYYGKHEKHFIFKQELFTLQYFFWTTGTSFIFWPPFASYKSGNVSKFRVGDGHNFNSLFGLFLFSCPQIFL